MIDVADIPAILRRHILLLFVTPLLFMVLAFLYLSLKTPEYRASSELLVEPAGFQVLPSEQSGSFGQQAQQALDIDSQLYVLTSASVLNDVANKLDLDNDSALHRPGLLARLMGRTGASPGSDAERRAETITALREHLVVIRLDRSSVFRIQARHPNPMMAAAIANEVANSYLTETRDSRNSSLIRASESLAKQAAELRKRVEQAEAAVETYKSNEGLISTGTAGPVVDQQIQSLNTQLTQARVTLEQARTAFELVEPLRPSDVEAGVLPQNETANSVLSSLRVQYAQIAQQEAEAATTLGTSHPRLRELRSQLQNTRRQIADELQRIKQSLKNQFDQARGTLAALETRLTFLQNENSLQGKARIELRQLESEAEASRAVYETFLRRTRELEEQPEIETDGSRVLSEAQIPTRPSGPRKLFVLIAAGAFGFIAAAGSVVGLAILNGNITSERDLVTRTGVPILTHIPSPNRGAALPFAARLPRLSGSHRNAELETNLAITRIAYALRQAFAEKRPTTVLVLSLSDGLNPAAISKQVAIELHDMGETVLFARAEAPATWPERHEASSPLGKRNASAVALLRQAAQTMKLGMDSETKTQGKANGLSRYVSVEQIGAGRKYGAYASLSEAVEDFLIVDAGSAESSPILPVLLRHCDGIVLVSRLSDTRCEDLDRTLAYLEPWQDRVIGNVVLEAA